MDLKSCNSTKQTVPLTTTMDQAAAPPQETRKRTAIDEDHETENGSEWQLVAKKSKKTTKETENTTVQTTQRNKFKVVAANSTEAYKRVALLNEKHPTLKFTAKPNLKGEWIITPHDARTPNAKNGVPNQHFFVPRAHLSHLKYS